MTVLLFKNFSWRGWLLGAFLPLPVMAQSFDVAAAGTPDPTLPAADVPAPDFSKKAESASTPPPEQSAEPAAPLRVTLNGKPLPTPEPLPMAAASPEKIVPLVEPDKDPKTPAQEAAAAKPAPSATPQPPDSVPLPDITSTPDIAPKPGSYDALSSTAPMTPSQNVVINLINRLVQRGVLTKEDAAELIKQAEADTLIAQEQVARQQAEIAQAAAAQMIQDHAAIMQADAQPPPDENAISVSYVPEMIKQQMREQIRVDIMQQAREEGWIAPHKLPPWVTKLQPFADIRVRYEADFFPAGNDNTGAFPNFNAINTGEPFDVAGNEFSPQLNVDQDRNRMRLRARFGIAADLGEDFSAGLRIATGENNSPVSANQSLGLANQSQGGQFSKYAIWLDRAFIRYTWGETPLTKLDVTFGRFDNPFFTASTIMWDDEIGFDGVALQASYEVARGFAPFIVAGAFPVFNTDFNFSSNQPSKFKSTDKWLLAGQAGFDWQVDKLFNVEFGGGYYYFYNVEGRLSTPYTPLTPDDAGDTDDTRPSFAQKGNTYMALRNIIPDASNDFGTINQWQYFGLATPYQVLAFSGKLDFNKFEPFVVSLSGEVAYNLAFNQEEINAVAVNNRGALDDDLSDDIGVYEGGNLAWAVQIQVGTAALEKRWDWNLGFGYRYVESDAVIDGFAESDFGGGGTNLQGYVVSGNLALSSNVWIGVRWMSAESIAGPPFKEDIIQFDINAKF